MKDEKLKRQEKLSSKKPLITKEKYDNVWKVIFSILLVFAFIGIFFMIKNVTEFRNKLKLLNPNYDLPQFSDFKICIPLFILISLIKYIASPRFWPS